MMADRSEQSLTKQHLNMHGAMKMNQANNQLSLTLAIFPFARLQRDELEDESRLRYTVRI